jgi:hypothetical protein
MTREPNSPTPEESLLLGVASRVVSAIEPPDDDQRQQFSGVFHGRFDWPKFLHAAHRQKCLAAVYRYVCDLGLERMVPSEVAEVLKSEHNLAQAMYAKKLAELKRLIGTLQSDGVDPVVIKGIPLAVRLYTDPALRVSKDIDLLCKTEDLDRVERLLEATGYFRYEGRITHEEYRKHHYHFVYVLGEHADSVVEVHWNLRQPDKGDLIAMDAVRQRARVVEIDGRGVRTFDDSDALWQLGVNLSYEGFLDLRDLADLRRLSLQMSDGDWIRLADFSRQNGTYNEFSTALAVSERAFGRFVPDEIRRRVRPNWFIRKMLLPTYLPRGIVWRWAPFKDTHQLVVYFFLRKGLARKLSYLYRLSFPTRGALIETRASESKPSKPRELLRFYATGLWMLTKVVAMITLLAFLVKTGLLGRHGLDPERHVQLRHLPNFES